MLFASWCLNEIAYIAAFAVDADGGEGFGFSLLWFVLAVPCSFVCWYWPVYKAFKYGIVRFALCLTLTWYFIYYRSDSSMWFMIFFFVFFFQILAFIVYAIGIPKSGNM